MHLELTLAAPVGTRDVVVTGPPDARLSDALPALRALCGQPAQAGVWLAGRQLCDGARLDELPRGVCLDIGRASVPPRPAGLVALDVVGGPGAGLSVPLGQDPVTIGRGGECEVVLADPNVSRRHAVLETGTGALLVRDLGSTNGTSVEGRPVGRVGTPIRAGELIAVGDSRLMISGPSTAAAKVRNGENGARVISRAPRAEPVLNRPDIVLPVPREANRPSSVQWLSAALPAAAGAAFAWLAGSPEFLLFALLSPVMMIGSGLGDRLHWRRTRRREAATYRARRLTAERAVAEAAAEETACRRTAFPDAAAVGHLAALPSARLWERRGSDPDALDLRLGLAELPSTTATFDGRSRRPAARLADVPYRVKLDEGPLGVVAPAEAVAGIGRWIIGQLTALNPPGDLHLLLVSVGSDIEWRWARWLPHLRRVIEPTDEAMTSELAALIAHRRSAQRVSTNSWVGSRLVVVSTPTAATPRLPAGLGETVARGAEVGVSAVFLSDDEQTLPRSCRSVARARGDLGSWLEVRSGDGVAREVLADRVSREWADQLARDLAPLVDAEAQDHARLDTTCHLLHALGVAEGLGPDGVERRWSSNDGGARTVVGVGLDGPVIVDLSRDGPHTLIAGTTGAGKSELLRSLIAGLALHQPPDELNLLLIDYKGGAAFADCAQLPHATGLVTDLDTALTTRALRSLDCELRTRERLFADVGASDLTSYRAAAGRSEIARLVIVVDEFATLVDELPDFVRGLVSVAQRGRSLGVHLILATQRPGTSVSPEIRANTSLRIALRMTDAAESVDVIAVPDAALIDRTAPGRGVLRAGESLTEFRAPLASGRTPSTAREVRVEPLDAPPADRAPEEPAPTSDLAQLTKVIADTARRYGRTPARPPWLPPLPRHVPVAELEPAAPFEVPFGLVDLPAQQRRETQVFRLQGESLLVTGGPHSGRSSAVASIATAAAQRVDPGQLELQAIDSSGGLRDVLHAVPHCGSVLGPDELDLAPTLLARIDAECRQRLADRRARVPTLLLAVDGWEGIVAHLSDVEALACAEHLASILRTGPKVRVAVLLTGDRGTLAPRFAGAFTTRLLLRLTEPSDYALAGLTTRDLPIDPPAGRALRVSDGAALQLAYLGAAPGLAALRDETAKLRHSPAPPRRIGVRPLPSRIRLGELTRQPGRRWVLGVGGDSAATVSIDLFAGSGRLLVAGPPRAGRSSLLRLLAAQARTQDTPTVIAAPPRSPLSRVAHELRVPLITPESTGIDAFPEGPVLVLMDDSETFLDSPAEAALADRLRAIAERVAIVVAGRTEELATAYRGIAAEVRRHHCGVLLRPGPIDGDLLGVRLPRRPGSGPPGRGLVVGDPSWGPPFDASEPLPIQVATP